MSEAACPATGVNFQQASSLIAPLCSPIDKVLWPELQPRPACYAVLSLLQICVGYFWVLAVRRRQELRKRLRFAAGRRLRRARAKLEALQRDRWPPLLAAYLSVGLTWQVLVGLLRSL